MTPVTVTTSVLRVDAIACAGHGVCAELLPELITLDDWGYPIIDGRPFPDELLAHARRAATNCPALALHLEKTRDRPKQPAATSSQCSGTGEGKQPARQ